MDKFKYWLINGILIIIGTAAIIRITVQYNILREAKIKNAEVQGKIEKLKEDNLIWIAKINYATTSAYMEREVRNKLGMGKEGDVWINESTQADIDLYPKVETTKDKNNWQEWIDLFTR